MHSKRALLRTSLTNFTTNLFAFVGNTLCLIWFSDLEGADTSSDVSNNLLVATTDLDLGLALINFALNAFRHIEKNLVTVAQ